VNDTSDDSTIVSNFTSTETDVFFEYEVKLSRSEIFDRPLFANLKNVGEMIITSEIFAEYNDCAQDCYEMLNEFSKHLRGVGDKQYVIATKINPLHDPAHDGSKVSEDWIPETIIKMYLADAVALREEKTIHATISAVINVRQDIDLRSLNARSQIN
jgi:hypothetical protein